MAPSGPLLLGHSNLGSVFIFLLVLFSHRTHAYTSLSDDFLRLTPAVSKADLDPVSSGSLLAPLLQKPRSPGTAAYAAVQAHLVAFFQANLPTWTVHWVNTTSSDSRRDQAEEPREPQNAHLIFRREPPWTRTGQANLLTLVARYDDDTTPAAAASCVLLMHVARSIEAYAAQMYQEMQELGEGGTVPMDMATQVVFLGGNATDLAATWEHTTNPALSASRYGYSSSLDEIRLLVMLEGLGIDSEPRISSHFSTTHWVYAAVAAVEQRMRRLRLLGLSPSSSPSSPEPYLPDTRPPPVRQSVMRSKAQSGRFADYVPFMQRGVPVLPLVPDAAEGQADQKHVNEAVLRDWSRIVTGFVMEWLDMMEVAPQKT